MPSALRSEIVLDRLRELRRRLSDSFGLGVVQLTEFLEQGDETDARSAISIVSGEVSSTVEWLSICSQPNRHRPATAAGEQLHRIHVDRVDIRSLFSIHLDGDVVLIEIASDLFIVERLFLHHVAPVALHRPTDTNSADCARAAEDRGSSRGTNGSCISASRLL